MTDPRHLIEHRIRMRDGVALASDAYFPSNAPPWPVVLLRTPYGRKRDLYVALARTFQSRGFAFVIQDVRGRHGSDGEWVPYVSEGRDGFDTIGWLGAQSWASSRVGMIGGSYAGWVQWAAAREQPPKLAAMAATASAGHWMQELPFHNGIPWLTMLGWLYQNSGKGQVDTTSVDWQKVYRTLPLTNCDQEIGVALPEWQKWLEHDLLDDYWTGLRVDDYAADLDVPVLHITGWHDDDQPGALHFYRMMVDKSRAARWQRLLVGPWDHTGTRDPKRVVRGFDFGEAAVVDLDEVQLRWFEWHLKGGPALPGPGCQYFVGGTNGWASSDFWAPVSVPRRMHLYVATQAEPGELKDYPAAVTTSSSYLYDPRDPTIVLTDFDVYAPNAKLPSLDLSRIEGRSDVLTFTSAPFAEDFVLAGHPTAYLTVETDAVDTDWFVYVSEVHPSGESVLLGFGLRRARHLTNLANAAFQSPNSRYTTHIELSAFAAKVARGHRLRLGITSSWFPVYARNLNTGGRAGQELSPTPAHNTIHCGGSDGSYVVLPILPQCGEVAQNIAWLR